MEEEEEEEEEEDDDDDDDDNNDDKEEEEDEELVKPTRIFGRKQTLNGVEYQVSCKDSHRKTWVCARNLKRELCQKYDKMYAEWSRNNNQRARSQGPTYIMQ